MIKMNNRYNRNNRNNRNNQNNMKGSGADGAFAIRTVAVNKRGQIVIPEDIRRRAGIAAPTTLVMIERNGRITLRKESDVLAALGKIK